MRWLKLTLAVLVVAVTVAFGAWVANTDTVTAVEFYNSALERYLITADPQETTTLDAGKVDKGWVRTGAQFTAYTYPWPGRAPVCRFAGTARKAPSSHFFAAGTAECALAKQDPGWTYEKVAFYVIAPSAGACPESTYPVWRSRVASPDSAVNQRFATDLTAYSRMTQQDLAPEGAVMCTPVSDAEKEADIVRLLEQSTLGPTEALVREVKAKGIAPWIDEQLSLNVTRYTQYPYSQRPQDTSFASLCVDDTNPPATPEKYCHTYRISPSPVGWEFFRQAKSAPDQLRLRMAHVWHQIFVISDGNGTYVYADFHQRLRDNVFGTFENLLLKFTLSPQLGEYQNWIRNVPAHDGIRPNENFARELMQLFTIGVNELNEDGTVKLDGNGHLIPTYVQSDIETLARVLTGFDFPPMPGSVPSWGALNYYVGDMIPYDEHHDRGAKRLLNGVIDLPAGGGAMADVRTAIHALALHPNTPPFISRQLIQKLVTSAPTPGYVARVAAVFKDNGKGVRGDLAAVTRAILLDPEARGARKIDPEYGRLREPALFWTAMIRGLDITTDGVTPYMSSGQSGQLLFLAPSVFNYYPSDYTLAGGAVPAPEFGIFNSAEFLTRANQVNELLYHVDRPAADVAPVWGPQPYVVNATGTPSPPLTALVPDAGNVNVLVDRLDKLFLHGTMRPVMRKTIVDAVSKIAPEDALRRVKLATQLTLTSVDYQMQK
ncbi:MAG: DUF1800 family protein [Betaproteobacteria bacterium]